MPREADDELQRAIEIDNRNDYEKQDINYPELFKDLRLPLPEDAAQPVNHIKPPKRKAEPKPEPESAAPENGSQTPELNQGGGFQFKQPRPGSSTPIGLPEGDGEQVDTSSDDWREELPFPDAKD